MIDKAIASAANALKEHPSFLTVMVVTAAFLVFMDRQARVFEKRLALDEVVAEQRIQTCHDIQHRGILSMDKLADVLLEHETQFVAMQQILEETIRSNNLVREDVRRLLTIMEAHAQQHNND